MEKFIRYFSKYVFPSDPILGKLGSIDLNLNILQWSGLPLFGSKSEIKRSLFIYGILFSVFIRIPYHTFEIYDLITCWRNFNDMIQNVCMSFLHLGMCLKMIMIYGRLEDFYKIINQLRILTRKYVKSDKQKEVFSWMEFESKISITIYAFIPAITSVFGFILTIRNPSGVVGHILPYRAKMPDFTPFNLQLFYIPISNAMIGFQIVGIDYLNVAFMNLTRCQLRMLNISFDELNEEKVGRVTVDPLTHLKKLIEHHTYILEIRNQIESIFKFPMLVQFFGSLLVIALTGFQALNQSDTSGLVMVYMYVGCIMAELLVYCWFGTQISEQNESLALQGYNTSWYNFDVKYRKSLVIFLMNAQKPFCFTAGGYLKLSLMTFNRVVSKAFSIMAVLRQQYSDG
ncbi:odorant receptor 49b-like [Episyrphus balteatus]|uniref:odorant receptor 49b-like n=1 Tax=Episyrphus balteatus TaxID=286459 RepID=UPI002485FEAF|nr:odorant receptor 49b-like [Episyrphus balteatus]